MPPKSPFTTYQLPFTFLSAQSPANLPFLSPTLTVPTIFSIFAAPLQENVSKSLKKVEWHRNRAVANELFKSPIV
jgi:hypothetical protein